MKSHEIRFTDGVDWQQWITRWDRMQQYYVVCRQERFDLIARTVAAVQGRCGHILDLGCGTGSLMLEMLEAFPRAQVIGIDFDPTLLALAQGRLERFGDRAKLALADLRCKTWPKLMVEPVDAAVSATALHWFKQDELEILYEQLSEIMRSGGIFLNADHVASGSEKVQQAWQDHRSAMRREEKNALVDDWRDFWTEYLAVLGVDASEIHQRVLGGWEGGVEEGLSLTWHLDKLRKVGFGYVDCFWRRDCDAVYGGILT